jgi:periplasmic protein TonB
VNKTTVVLSVLLHAGVAVAVIGAAKRGPVRKTFSVQMTETAKKKAPPPKPQTAKPQPPKPKPAAPVGAAPKLAVAPKAAEAPTPKMTFEPVLTGIEMTNDDSAGGVVIPIRAPAAAAPTATKVASFEPEARRHRSHDLGPGPQLDQGCHDEPSKPEPVFKTEIEYTHAARAEGIEGKLKLKLIVGADGSVVGVEVLSSVSPELDAAAVAAVRQWRFKPAMACGKPVAGGTYIIARRFELGD